MSGLQKHSVSRDVQETLVSLKSDAISATFTAVTDDLSKVPIVFISYSHDTKEHKQWVAQFAGKLRGQGIEVILDQWDLEFGDDIAKFMEGSISTASRVLAICTEIYVRKADEGKGGVGYEQMIVTAELIANLGTNKFIPIFRQNKSGTALPKALGTRMGVNLAEGPNEQAEFEKLVEQIHKLPPLTKPPLGPGPRPKQNIPPQASIRDTDTTKGFVETPGAPRGLFPVIQVPKGDSVNVENSLDVYERALDLARANDVVAWRRLVRQISAAIAANLQSWIAKRTANMPKVESDLPEFALQAIGIYSPLFAVALAGVESSEPQFSQQSSILDEILHPKGWQRNGFSLIVDIPQTIAFAYQALHGALCLETRQLPLAMNLAGMQLASGRGDAVVKLYQRPEIVGWPSGLPDSSVKVWDFLIDLPNKLPWLNEPFGDAVRLKISALAYYECMSVLEFTNEIANGKHEEIVKTPAENTRLDVPVHLEKYTDEEAMRAHALLLEQKDHVASIWRSRAISDDVILSAWPRWADRHYYWLRRESWRGFANQRFDKLIADVLS